MREVFDQFLAKFPLCFGYWKKYADFEFTIQGPIEAEKVNLLCCSLEYMFILTTNNLQ